MKNLWMIGVVCFAGCQSAPDLPPVPTFADAKSDGQATPACSPEYWVWMNGILIPQLEKSVSEISLDDLNAIDFVRPDPAYTEQGNQCWQAPLFDRYVSAPMIARLGAARDHLVGIDEANSEKIKRFGLEQLITPEMSRNALYISQLRPPTMPLEDIVGWYRDYDTLLTLAINPVTVAGGDMDYAETEWQITANEQMYLSLYELNDPRATTAGALQKFLVGLDRWLNGPPPFAFDGRTKASDAMPIVMHYASMAPRSSEPIDGFAWMGLYDTYMNRVIFDRNSPATANDLLAQTTLEVAQPPRLIGLDTYRAWLHLYSTPGVFDDATRGPKVLAMKPCVELANGIPSRFVFSTAHEQLGDAWHNAAPDVCPM